MQILQRSKSLALNPKKRFDEFIFVWQGEFEGCSIESPEKLITHAPSESLSEELWQNGGAISHQETATDWERADPEHTCLIHHQVWRRSKSLERREPKVLLEDSLGHGERVMLLFVQQSCQCLIQTQPTAIFRRNKQRFQEYWCLER